MRKRRCQRIITYTLSALLVFSLFSTNISVYAESELKANGIGNSADAMDEEVTEVQALIHGLPGLEEIKSLTGDELDTVYEKVTEAYDAYELLTDEQKSKITGADIFDAVFAYMNEQVMPLEEGAIVIDVDMVTEDGVGYRYDSVNNRVTLLENYTFIVSGETSGKKLDNYGTISGRTFSGDVVNYGSISGGTFSGNVYNNGSISDGIFSGDVSNNRSGNISGGTFSGEVSNAGNISGGTFSRQVGNNGSISDGIFSGDVSNNRSGNISGGTFSGNVTSDGNISGGTFYGTVINARNGYITDGIFSGNVTNIGTINNGYYLMEITQGIGGVINTCNYPVKINLTNLSYTTSAETKEINGKKYTFATYSSSSGVGIAINITADTGYHVPDGINFNPALDVNGYTYTKSDNTAATVTINAPYVTKPITLNAEGTLAVIKINVDTVTDSGEGYTYDSANNRVTLLEKYTFIVSGGTSGKKLVNSGTISGSYSTYTGEIDNSGNISGGTFSGYVENHGNISDGIFSGDVRNYGNISGGTFSGHVDNSGNISGGTFSENVGNEPGGSISDGIFSGTVTNIGNISGGTFSGSVYNDGSISGGTFSRSVTNNRNGNITGGIFSGIVMNYGTINNGYYLKEITQYIGGVINTCNYPVEINLTNLSYTTSAETKEINGKKYTFATYGSSSGVGIIINITADTGYHVPDGINFNPALDVNGYTYTKSDNTAAVTINAPYVTSPITLSATGIIVRAPTPTVSIAEKAASMLTVAPLPNQDTYGTAQYSLDNNVWQASNVFEGLKASQTYTVYARYKGNDNYAASDAAQTTASTNAASYTITIPENATADGSDNQIEVNQSEKFDLGYNGRVTVDIQDNGTVQEGILTLTRENDPANQAVTSALLVNGTKLGSNNKVAAFTINDSRPVIISFSTPAEKNIPAGTYRGTVTFQVSYSEQ